MVVEDSSKACLVSRRKLFEPLCKQVELEDIIVESTFAHYLWNAFIFYVYVYVAVPIVHAEPIEYIVKLQRLFRQLDCQAVFIIVFVA